MTTEPRNRIITRNTDSHDVGTHYFGDGCSPPHECPADHSNRLKADMCGTCGLVYESED